MALDDVAKESAREALGFYGGVASAIVKSLEAQVQAKSILNQRGADHMYAQSQYEMKTLGIEQDCRDRILPYPGGMPTNVSIVMEKSSGATESNPVSSHSKSILRKAVPYLIAGVLSGGVGAGGVAAYSLYQAININQHPTESQQPLDPAGIGIEVR